MTSLSARSVLLPGVSVYPAGLGLVNERSGGIHGR